MAGRCEHCGRKGGCGDGGTLTVAEGDIITVDCLEWIDPYWDFDNPCVVLRPIYREFETRHAESAIEDVLIDLTCATKPVPVRYDGHHRWNAARLKRTFAEALAGKEFPQRNYEATRQQFRVVRDAHGLTFEDVEEKVN